MLELKLMRHCRYRNQNSVVVLLHFVYTTRGNTAAECNQAPSQDSGNMYNIKKKKLSDLLNSNLLRDAKDVFGLCGVASAHSRETIYKNKNNSCLLKFILELIARNII